MGLLITMRIVLLLVCAISFLAVLGVKNEQRGYLDLICSSVSAVLFFISFFIG